MDNGNAKTLCSAVLLQAIRDYRELRKNGSEHIKTKNQGEFSIGELESFFRGDWCRFLCRAANLRVSGPSILRKLESEFDT